MTDNQELKALAKADQADRTHCHAKKISIEQLREQDTFRLARVVEMIYENSLATSNDYANAAIILHHGKNTSSVAVKMMKKAIELDPLRNNWLLAAAIDRDLMNRKLPQIYGTQYLKQEDGSWTFYELDPSQISDEERKKYFVETLEEQKIKLKNLNKKELITLYDKGGIKEIIKRCEEEYLADSEYNVSMEGINVLGYQLRRIDKDGDALKIFQLNTKLYADHYDTYHSLGDCLSKMGKVEKAIQAFEKSLELNPNYDVAKRDLEILKNKK